MKETLAQLFSSAGFKFAMIGLLSLILLIPASMIRGLISERESRNRAVATEISESWSLSQTVSGPYLSIPVYKYVTINDNQEEEWDNLVILPENLKISARVQPETRKRGIFKVVVYNSEIHLTGSFVPEINKASINWQLPDMPPHLCIGIEDLRGIGTASSLKVNGTTYDILPGLPGRQLASKGVKAELPSELIRQGEKLDFDITLTLKGSSDLSFIPLGKTTIAEMTSGWPDPSFNGAFLPEGKEISKDGFAANWSVSYLNRNYPQEWIGSAAGIDESAFGVSFIIPVDHYQKATRAVKYAFMFIALTFLLFFLSEVITGARFHPVQYLLTGFALVIYYTLLVSLSEHTGFNLAYLISTVATTLLIAFYVQRSSGKFRITLITTFILAVLYGFLFTVLQIQDYALMIGSIGLFVVLAIVMVITGRIRWYKEEEGTN